jgi:hypothetical protein
LDARQFIHQSKHPSIHSPYRIAMEIAQLAQVLVALGCPAEKSAAMAAQLDKRAKQLAAEKNRPYDEALKHLITLMRQGWSAKEKGF